MRRADAPRSRSSLIVPVAQFALTGIAALVVVAFGGVKLFQHLGRDEAIRDARTETRLAGRHVVPELTPALLAGRPAAIARFDRLVRRDVLVDPVVRVKVWDATGRIVYSDQRALIGQRYPLGEEETDALRRRGVDAELSDLTRPENRYERPFDKLMEVYLGVTGPGGRPLLFETYQRYSSIAASGDRVWRSLAWPLVGALVVLWLAQIPLAWSLARRLRRGQDERELLLRRGLESSELERRQIAADIHDGVVQDLVGLSLTLDRLAAERRAQDPAAAAELADAASATRGGVRGLRGLLVDIYPPSLERGGIAAAVADLVESLPGEDLDARLDVDPELPALDRQTEQLLFRGAQEALRNVVKHAGAHELRVGLHRVNGSAVALTVEDDGVGPGTAADGGAEGHMGLRILSDLAALAGGSLTVTARPAGGTRFDLRVTT